MRYLIGVCNLLHINQKNIMTQKTKRLIKQVMKRYSKKLGYEVEPWEVMGMYTDGRILLSDQEEDALSSLL